MTKLVKRTWLLLFVWCAMVLGISAQPISPTTAYNPLQTKVNTPLNSYADLYRKELKQTHRTGVSARTYTINKQFYNNPNISPYLNLTRPGGRYTPRYQAYVKPELARRQEAVTRYNNQSHPGRPTSAPTIANRPNPYYSKYYTGR